MASAATARLEATTNQIVAEVRLLPAEVIKWIPAKDVWSVMDILCHIREFVPYWTDQTLRIVREPQQTWGRDHTDPARLAAVADTSRYELEPVLADIQDLVKRSARTLGDLSDADLSVEAMSRNPRWARKPASFVVEHLIVQHLERHLGQIRRNAAQFVEARAKA